MRRLCLCLERKKTRKILEFFPPRRKLAQLCLWSINLEVLCFIASALEAIKHKVRAHETSADAKQALCRSLSHHSRQWSVFVNSCRGIVIYETGKEFYRHFSALTLEKVFSAPGWGGQRNETSLTPSISSRIFHSKPREEISGVKLMN